MYQAGTVVGMDWERTEDNGVELVGALVDVWQKDAAGLEGGEKLRLTRLGEGGQELVAALRDAQLQNRRVVRDSVHLLHACVLMILVRRRTCGAGCPSARR